MKYPRARRPRCIILRAALRFVMEAFFYSAPVFGVIPFICSDDQWEMAWGGKASPAEMSIPRPSSPLSDAERRTWYEMVRNLR